MQTSVKPYNTLEYSQQHRSRNVGFRSSPALTCCPTLPAFKAIKPQLPTFEAVLQVAGLEYSTLVARHQFGA